MVVRMNEVHNDSGVYTYEVNEDGKERVYRVSFNSISCDVSCCCMLYESMGVLCHHALKAMELLEKDSETISMLECFKKADEQPHDDLLGSEPPILNPLIAKTNGQTNARLESNLEKRKLKTTKGKAGVYVRKSKRDPSTFLRKERLSDSPGSNRHMNPSAAGSMGTMDGFIVHCDRHWIDDQVMGPISFAYHEDKYMSGSNQSFGPVPSPGYTPAEKDQRTPASTTKHAEAEVDDSDSFDTSDTEDESSSDEHAATDCREVKTNGVPNSSTPSTTTRWTIPGSELYLIQPIRSKELFQDNGDFSEIYNGQMFKDKKTLKGALGFNTLQKRAGKSRNGTYWNVKSIDSEHTCGDNGNYNVDFHRVSSHVIGQLFARKFVDPGRNIRPKYIMTDMKDKHGINLTYNKAYRSKDRALHSVFGDPWESFKTLPSYFHMLEKSNPRTKTKNENDRKNRFKYGFMALGACIEGFNTVIRPIIAVDATHLKSMTKGVLLVTVCKDGNEMIYPLAFGFANSECSKSWTWFLKQLHDVILHPELVMIVSDRYTGISNGMRAIFLNGAHGVCAYHLAKNLKQHCRK
ncbi:hypothetical protein Dsin_001937 [Dipteronia sinensis]|uniref:SWIM-type domain-containing protein n=1 Tax=Dipteronia sinensis TaxID=43782 RepID=A0AAE0B5B5_9ROSI|nr:hypothetical protein Dsin_001937 [Dipteronia sinensis]